MKRTLTLLVVSLLAGGPMLSVVAEAASEKRVKATKKDRRECRRVKPTGSHIKQRVCLRSSEWQAMEDEARRKLEQRQNQVSN